MERNNQLLLLIIGGLVITFSTLMSSRITLPSRHEPKAIGIMNPPEKRAQPGVRRIYEPPPLKQGGKYTPIPHVDGDEDTLFTLKTACRQNIAVINTQIELWYMEKEAYPKNDLSDIGRDVDYFPNGIPPCPLDGSAYVLDPDTHRVAGHTHEDIPNLKALDDLVNDYSAQERLKKQNPSPNSKQNRK